MWEGVFLDSMTKAGWSALALDRPTKVIGLQSTGDRHRTKASSDARWKNARPRPFSSRIRWERFWPRDFSAGQEFQRWSCWRQCRLMFETPLLFATQPSLWHGLGNFLNGQRESAFQSMVDIIFSRQVENAELDRQTAKMVFGSPGTVFDAHVPVPVMPAFCVGVPALVIAGAEDKLISHLASIRTALYHGAEYRNEDKLGHFMQIGPGAQRTADFIIDWLKRKGR
jgi:pimeloyl-ACP methyl ester carboxylesterase